MIEYIQENMPLAELLAQLAEEAAELGHAALKLRRVIDGKNPTPVTFDEAFENLKEEIADVLLSLKVMGMMCEPQSYENEMNSKLERWVRRLKGESNEG